MNLKPQPIFGTDGALANMGVAEDENGDVVILNILQLIKLRDDIQAYLNEWSGE